MASQLEADIKKENSRLWYCSKEGQNSTLWFDPLNMAPFAFDCWEDNIRLSYDFKSRRTMDTPGVTVREAGFDDVSSLRFSSKIKYPFSKFASNYTLELLWFHFLSAHIFNALIDSLVAKGYKENLNLRAAPYDWRRAPCKQRKFLKTYPMIVYSR